MPSGNMTISRLIREITTTKNEIHLSGVLFAVDQFLSFRKPSLSLEADVLFRANKPAMFSV
jgi:hypothetical protein